MKRPYDLGFLGGGQLARMSIQAAQRMGLRCLSLDVSPDSPASQIAESVQGSLDDADAIATILVECDRVTLENEFIPARSIREAFGKSRRDEACLVPGTFTLETIQDKFSQRKALEAANVPSAHAVAILDNPDQAVREIGFPMVLKSRFGGYDGKGTRYARNADELESHRELWGAGGWMAEAYVPFVRELAVMVFVAENQVGTFPTMETVQTNHVCDLVFPSGVDASQVAMEAVRAVRGHGLFGVELFELNDGSFVINELAPRPHNTGHYSLDWGGVSQFEQHVRLAMGFPCDSPVGNPVCMANLLGLSEVTGNLQAAIAAATQEPGVHVHWYGKGPRLGRKVGHINVVGENCVERAKQARARFWNAYQAE